jgi:ferrochelatase
VGPIGFISDHMEVVWDLDTLAQHTADRVGVAMARSSTPGTDPRFTEMVAELIAEQTSGAAPRRLGAEPLLGATANGAPCAADCCVSARPPHPTGAAR